MAFTLNGSGTAGGTGTSASITHGLTIASGDLVCFFLNSNSSSAASVDADAGATWTTALAEQQGTSSAYNVTAWKVANASEPSSYSFTCANAQWRVILLVFSASSSAVIDSAANSVMTASGGYIYMRGEAITGRTISNNAVSVLFYGKDTRKTTGSEDYTTSSDANYTIGPNSQLDQTSASAYRIYGASDGETYSGRVDLDVADLNDGQGDQVYSVHLSFLESGGGGSVAPLAGNHLRKMMGQ